MKSMTRNIFIAAIFSLLTAAALGFIFLREAQRMPEATAAISGEQLERGARDYEQYCASCHGMAGQGQVANAAPQLNNIAARDLTPGADGVAPFDQPLGIKEKYGTLTNYVETTLFSGVRGAAMPAFGAQGTLRDDQIRNITAYVLNWNDTVPEAALVAANLEATRIAPTPDPNANPVDAGGALFQAQCSACHNMNSEKKVGPGLGGLFSEEGTAAYGTQFPNGEEVNEENFHAWMRGGSAGFTDFIEPQDGQEYPRAMPAFASLSEEQLEQLSIWLRVHDRDGNETDEANQIRESSGQPAEGDASAAPQASDGASPAASPAASP